MAILRAELVVDLRKHKTLKEAERALYLAFRRLKRRARRYFGRFEYATFPEISQRGWPRLLLLARGADVPRKWLAENWTECGGARITNVELLRSLTDVIDALQPYQFTARRESAETRRRTRFSGAFFKDLLHDVAVAPEDMAYWSAYRVKFGGGYAPSQYKWRMLFVEALYLAREETTVSERGNDAEPHWSLEQQSRK